LDRIKRKQRLAELTKSNVVYIVEDDYLAGLETNSKSDPIRAFNGASHVIYLRSFSKVMARIESCRGSGT